MELAFPIPRSDDKDGKSADREYEFRVGQCVRPNWPEVSDTDSALWAVVVLRKPNKTQLIARQFRYFGFSNATCSDHNAVANASHPKFMNVASYMDTGPFRASRPSLVP